MESNYKKIEYETEGIYGSTEKHWLYIESNRTTDVVKFYDEDGEFIFSFGEWGNFDMGRALVTALTNWNDEKMIDLTYHEITKLHGKYYNKREPSWD